MTLFMQIAGEKICVKYQPHAERRAGMLKGGPGR
jgi:hypothetical protein